MRSPPVVVSSSSPWPFLAARAAASSARHRALRRRSAKRRFLLHLLARAARCFRPRTHAACQRAPAARFSRRPRRPPRQPRLRLPPRTFFLSRRPRSPSTMLLTPARSMLTDDLVAFTAAAVGGTAGMGADEAAAAEVSTDASIPRAPLCVCVCV